MEIIKFENLKDANKYIGKRIELPLNMVGYFRGVKQINDHLWVLKYIKEEDFENNIICIRELNLFQDCFSAIIDNDKMLKLTYKLIK